MFSRVLLVDKRPEIKGLSPRDFTISAIWLTASSSSPATKASICLPPMSDLNLLDLPDHLIRESPFIVIPRHDLYQVTVNYTRHLGVDNCRKGTLNNV